MQSLSSYVRALEVMIKSIIFMLLTFQIAQAQTNSEEQSQSKKQVVCAPNTHTFDDLQKKLAQSDGVGQWQKLIKAIQERIEVISQREAESNEKDINLSCGYYLLAEAYFFISAATQNEGFYTFQAQQWLYKSEILNPGVLLEEQASFRLEELWNRLAKLFKKEKWVSAPSKAQLTTFGKSQFTQSQKLYLLEIESSKPFDLKFGLPKSLQNKWQAICGLSLDCQKPLTWSLSIKRNQKVILPILPGLFEFEFSGPCLKTPIIQQFQLPSTQVFEVPSMQCFSKLIVVDQISQEEMGDFFLNGQKQTQTEILIPEGKEIEISHPAYQKKIGQIVPNDGSVLKVELSRCAIPIEWKVTPSDAQVKGLKQMIWGEETSFEISRSGYVTQTYRVTPSKPEDCAQAIETRLVEMSRAFEIEAKNEFGGVLPAYALQINQLPVSEIKQQNGRNQTHWIMPLQRRAGTYRFEAKADSYETIKGDFNIPPCDQKVCTTPKFQINFEPIEKEALHWKGMTYSGIVMGLAGVLGLYMAHQKLEIYQVQSATQNSQLNEIHNQSIQDQQNLAMALLGLGLTTTVSSFVIPMLFTSKNLGE